MLKHRERQIEQHDKISTILEEMSMESKLEKEQKLAEQDFLFESCLESAGLTISKTNRELENERREREVGLKLETARDLFTSIVYRSLPIEKETLNENKEYVINRTREFFNMLVENNLFRSVDEKGAWQQLVEMCSLTSKEIALNDLNESESINKLVNNSQIITNEAVSIINRKVEDAIKLEKDLSTFEESLDKSSLFRSLCINNYKNVLVENNETENITHSEDRNRITLLESTLDYTLLETLNTLKIIEFTESSLRSNFKYLNK